MRTAATDYVTIVQQACDKVTGFLLLYKEMERAISISGKSKSTLTNYSRQLAHLALHYNCFPLELDAEQVMDYLHLVKSRGTVSAIFLSLLCMDYATPAGFACWSTNNFVYLKLIKSPKSIQYSMILK